MFINICRCIARNMYFAKQRLYTPNVHVFIGNYSSLNSSLLPALQNSSINIINGTDLQLCCAPYNRESVKWSFIPLTSFNKQKIDLDSTYKLVVENAIQLKHDGQYNCSTSTDFQVHLYTYISQCIKIIRFL